MRFGRLAKATTPEKTPSPLRSASEAVQSKPHVPHAVANISHPPRLSFPAGNFVAPPRHRDPQIDVGSARASWQGGVHIPRRLLVAAASLAGRWVGWLLGWLARKRPPRGRVGGSYRRHGAGRGRGQGRVLSRGRMRGDPAMDRSVRIRPDRAGRVRQGRRGQPKKVRPCDRPGPYPTCEGETLDSDACSKSLPLQHLGLASYQAKANPLACSSLACLY